MRLSWCLLLGALAGCPTSFIGDAHFPGGVESCRNTCSRQGLELGAFVYSGEYSTSCVCRPAAGPAAATPTADDEIQAQAAAAAAASAAANNAAEQRRRHQQSQQ
ncbi:MAG TPA: hypothetical protein VK932_03170 [Kofleriaceae bacterium]|nr:hypothetical protein [Kofleriaceae bacterium]